jgi:hypothetical protein
VTGITLHGAMDAPEPGCANVGEAELNCSNTRYQEAA